MRSGVQPAREASSHIQSVQTIASIRWADTIETESDVASVDFERCSDVGKSTTYVFAHSSGHLGFMSPVKDGQTGSPEVAKINQRFLEICETDSFAFGTLHYVAVSDIRGVHEVVRETFDRDTVLDHTVDVRSDLNLADLTSGRYLGVNLLL